MTKPTLSDDCLCGRSQLFTFKTKETITVDRVELERLLALLNSCLRGLTFAVGNSIFPEALKIYLSVHSSAEGDKALTLLSPWCDTVPEALQEISEGLDEAERVIEFILAASAGVRND